MTSHNHEIGPMHRAVRQIQDLDHQGSGVMDDISMRNQFSKRSIRVQEKHAKDYIEIFGALAIQERAAEYKRLSRYRAQAHEAYLQNNMKMMSAEMDFQRRSHTLVLINKFRIKVEQQEMELINSIEQHLKEIEQIELLGVDQENIKLDCRRRAVNKLTFLLDNIQKMLENFVETHLGEGEY